MARLTARIMRLEALDGARASDKFAHLTHLSDAELDARLCQVAQRLADEWREMLRGGMSVADIMVEIGRSPDNPFIAALLAEAQAPAFDAARFFAARKEKRGAAG